MADKIKKAKSGPNLLNVSLRMLIMAVLSVGAYSVYKLSGSGELPMLSKIGIGVLLGAAAIILIQLIVWGLKWVRHERVSELGLHIVRFAVTLTAVALCVFVLLSFDYAELYSATEQNELRQHALAGRIYIQNEIGDGVADDEQFFVQLGQAVNGMLLENEQTAERYACLYIKTESDKNADSGFAEIADGYIGVSTNPDIPCAADAEQIERVLSRAIVEVSDNQKIGTYNIVSAYSPVFTKEGEPVGVLEICDVKHGGMDIFHFATLELCLKLLALIAFFSFAFYGFMQLVDILLRPRQFDRSRRLLSCGRESARPVLFLVAFSAALPVMMLLFAENLRALAEPVGIPFGIGSYLPLVVYLAGIAIGQLIARRETVVLSEIPADVGLVISFLCNLALCLFMDWKKLSSLGMADNILFMFLLILVCGLGYGVAYRITAKFQAQADAMFGYDKYVYLCTCLGVMSGIVLGGLLIENYSNVTLRIISCILTAFTAVIAIILLENLKSTVDAREIYKDTLTSYAGGIMGILPVGLACCVSWIYLTGYMFNNDISIAAISFCAVAPIIAFCFGNRLRIRNRTMQKLTVAVSGIIAAGSFLPMVFAPSFKIAVLSCALVCLAVIFASSGVYSMARHGEIKKICSRLIPLLLLGIVIAAVMLNIEAQNIALIAAAGVSIASLIIFVISKFPSRPIIGSNMPAITDGKQKKNKPDFAAPVIIPDASAAEPEKSDDAKQEEADKADKKEKKKKEKKEKRKKTPIVPIVTENENSDAEEQKTEETNNTAEEEKEEKSEDTPFIPIIIPEQEEKAEDPAPIFEESFAAEPAPEETPAEEPKEAASEETPAAEETPSEEPEEREEQEEDPIVVIFDEPEEIPSVDPEPEETEQSEQPAAEESQPQADESNGEAEMTPEEMEAARMAAVEKAKENWRKYNSDSSAEV